MTATVLRRACDRCNKSKLNCDKQPSCSRCVKSKVKCTYDRPLGTLGRPKSNPETKVKYSHSACLNCKKRKKKCDEAWPQCLGCHKLGVECPGPGKKARRFKFDERNRGIISHTLANREEPGNDQRENSSSMDPIGFGKNGGSTGNLGQNGYSGGRDENLHANSINGQISGIDGQLGLQAPGSSPEYDGSVLKAMDIDSMALSPHLNAFLAPQDINVLDLTNDLFNDETNFLSTREKWLLNSLVRSPTFPADYENGHDQRRTEENGAVVSPEETFEEEKLSLITSLSPYNVPEKELELLKYFITDVSSILFVDKTSTRFLSTVVPLSMADGNVRYPILGISASHRANTSSGIEFKRESAIYRARSQCLFIVNNLNLFDDTENLLLSILLVAVQEIFVGTSLYWGFALEKAAEIIGKRGGLKIVSRFAPLSVQLFCYLDLISSLSTCSSPYVHKSEFGEYDEDHIENILNNKFGFKSGIAGEIFKIIGNISTLASLRTSRHDSEENEKKFNSLATLIEMRLQNWSPMLDGKRYSVDSSMDYGRLVLSKFTVALQWSAFLRLHQIRNGYNRKDQRVEACLDLILSSMKEIPPDSGLETGLMFPLIMAGSVAYLPHDREYILCRIRSIKARLKLDYVGEFEKLILSVWERDAEEGNEVNWAKIRYYEYPGLVMF